MSELNILSDNEKSPQAEPPQIGAPQNSPAHGKPLFVEPLPPLVVSQGKKPQAPLVITLSKEEQAVAQVEQAVAQAQAAAAQAQPQPQVVPQPQPQAQVVPQSAQAQAQTTEQAQSPLKKKRKKNPQERKNAKIKRFVFTALRDALIAVALLIILLQFLSPTIVRERSMEDTLKENDILYIAKQAYLFDTPQYTDIIVFRTMPSDGSDDEKSLVKRIVGLPGDTVSVRGGTVFRNGEALSEPYLKSGETPGDMADVMVPENSYFVLGDNREVSNDSRNPAIGFVEKDQLQGKVVVRIFPLSEFRTF